MKTNSQWCGAIPPNASMPLRPLDDIQPDEWARYAKGQRTTDTRKLATLLPSWLKASLFKPPAPLAIDLSQRPPSYVTALCAPPSARRDSS